MEISVRARSISDRSITSMADIKTPATCPHCTTNYNPNVLDASYIRQTTKVHDRLFVLYFCTYCEKCFLVEYLTNNITVKHSCLYPKRTYPAPSKIRVFPSNIENVSKRFIQIYNESYLAEQHSLLEICGVGYRKALEFLVKDYAIFINKSNENLVQQIKSMQLSQCIEKYIDSEHIKTLSKACAWIGNDETHYVRKHKDYNLEHLKTFINSTVSFIDSVIEFYNAQHFLNDNSIKKD